MKRAVFFILAVLLTCVASHIAGRVQGRRTGRQEGYIKGFAAGWDAPHPADTIRDTVTIFAPLPVASRPAPPKLVPVRDTIRETDTLWMYLPTEVKTYAGEDFRAEVSGWQPKLESLTVFPKTVIRDAKRPRVGFGLAAGAGVVWTPDGWRAGPGIAGGVVIHF